MFERLTNRPALFSSLMVLFFIWGFVTLLNDLLVPILKQSFDLNYFQAMLIQFCFFVAYLIMSLPMASLMNKLHYKKGIILGLFVIALGCLLFLPANSMHVYAMFLLALFVLATGVVILQVSANPLVTILGTPDNAPARLTLAQGINSFGYFLTPLLVASIATAANLTNIYITIAVFMVLVMFFVWNLDFSKLQLQSQSKKISSSVWEYPGFLLAVFAIFLYVGSEVSVGSVIINFLGLHNVVGLDISSAAKMLAFYWGGAMVGRLLAAPVLVRLSASKVLSFNAVINCILIVVAAFSSGHVAMWSILLIGLFNSVMFPVIFSLGISRFGTEALKNKGSGWLVMAIVGGAILPVAVGFLADHVGLQHSLLVLVLSYGFIAFAGKGLVRN